MFNPEDVMIEQKSKLCASGLLLVFKILKTASSLNKITPSSKRQEAHAHLILTIAFDTRMMDCACAGAISSLLFPMHLLTDASWRSRRRSFLLSFFNGNNYQVQRPFLLLYIRNF